jgi:SAM-dependent methyltransferase
MLQKILQRISFGQKSWDPVAYWSQRAASPETMSVMWNNFTFNDLVDRDEWEIIARHLPSRRDAVLDLGCGTGRMSHRLAAKFRAYTGVDMEAMVVEARRRNASLADRFVAATVDAYEFPAERFDLVLSLGCVATACSKEKLADLAPRIARSVRAGGRLLFIEPFHRSWLFTRGCKTTPEEVASLFERHGMVVDDMSGMLFPPLRMMLSEKVFEPMPRLTKMGYRAGEAVVRLSPVLLADYKVVSLTKHG